MARPSLKVSNVQALDFGTEKEVWLDIQHCGNSLTTPAVLGVSLNCNTSAEFPVDSQTITNSLYISLFQKKLLSKPQLIGKTELVIGTFFKNVDPKTGYATVNMKIKLDPKGEVVIQGFAIPPVTLAVSNSNNAHQFLRQSSSPEDKRKYGLAGTISCPSCRTKVSYEDSSNKRATCPNIKCGKVIRFYIDYGVYAFVARGRKKVPGALGIDVGVTSSGKEIYYYSNITRDWVNDGSVTMQWTNKVKELEELHADLMAGKNDKIPSSYPPTIFYINSPLDKKIEYKQPQYGVCVPIRKEHVPVVISEVKSLQRMTVTPILPPPIPVFPEKPAEINKAMIQTITFLQACGNGDFKKVTDMCNQNPALPLTAFAVTNGASGAHKSMKKDHVKLLTFFLENHLKEEHLNICTNKGFTLLHYAAKYDAPECTKALLERGADRFAVNKFGMTPYNLAVEKKAKKFLNVWIDHEQPPFYAVLQNDVGKLRRCLETGMSPSFKSGCNEISLLHFAAVLNRGDIVTELLKRKASPNAKDIFGRTPLHYAAEYGCEEALSSFLDQEIYLGSQPDKDSPSPKYERIDVNAQDYSLWTPLHLAASKQWAVGIGTLANFEGINPNIKDLYYELTPLHIASALEDGACVQNLLEIKADPSIKDVMGQAPKIANTAVDQGGNLGQAFLTAVKKNDYNAVKEKLETENLAQSLEVRTKENALHLAVKLNLTKMTELLLEYGVDMFHPDASGKTPSALVAERRSLSNAEFDPKIDTLFQRYSDVKAMMTYAERDDATKVASQIEKGVPLMARNIEGKTVLHIVAVRKAQSCIDTLSQIPEVNWNVYSGEGKTPLIHAIDVNAAVIVPTLIAAGARIDIPDRFHGMTPLHWAVKGQYYECVKALLQLGAAHNKKATKAQKTPLELSLELYNSKDADSGKIVDLLRWFEHGDRLIRESQQNNVEKVTEMVELDELRQLLMEDSSRLIHQNAPADIEKEINKGEGERARTFISVVVSEYQSIAQLYRKEYMKTTNSTEGLKRIELANSPNAPVQLIVEILFVIIKMMVLKPEPDFPDLIQFTDSQKRTALHWAAIQGNNCVDILLSKGADVLVPDSEGKVPIEYAKDDPRKEGIVKSLTKHENEMLLFSAVEKKRKREAERLVVAEKTPVDCVNSRKETPLFIAVKGYDANSPNKTYLEIMRFLLEKGSNPNRKNRRGSTPLHEAIQNQDLSALELLLDYGAAIIPNGANKTQLEVAIALKDKAEGIWKAKNTKENENALKVADQIKKTLEDRFRGLQFLEAVKMGDWSKAMKAVGELQVEDQKSKARQQEIWQYVAKETGFNAFHVAISANQWDIVKRLAQAKKTDVLLEDKSGKTPLKMATARLAPKEILSLLKKAENGTAMLEATLQGDIGKLRTILQDPGSDIDYTNMYSQTAMHYAAALERIEIIDMLEERGAAIDKPDEDGDTPLHWAAYEGLLKSVETLLKFNANPNAKNNALQNPVFYALARDRLEVAALLLQNKGVITNTENDLIYFAAKKGSSKTLDLIIKSVKAQQGLSLRLDLNKHDPTDGKTALIHAVRSGNRLTLDVLLEHNVDVNKTDKQNKSPLQYACSEGNPKIVRALLEAGASLSIGDETKKDNQLSVIHTALLNGDDAVIEEIVDFLWKNPDRVKEIKNLSAVEQEIEVEADEEKKSASEKEKDTEEELKKLRETVQKMKKQQKKDKKRQKKETKGEIVDPDSDSEDEKKKKEEEIKKTVKTVIKKVKFTLFQFAIVKEAYSLVQLLVFSGMRLAKDQGTSCASPAAKKKIAGMEAVSTMIHAARQGNPTLLLKQLKKVGSLNQSIDTLDLMDGNSALHCAVTNGHVDIVEILLKAGASQTVENSSKKTALDLLSLHHENAESVTKIKVLLANPPEKDPSLLVADLSEDSLAEALLLEKSKPEFSLFEIAIGIQKLQGIVMAVQEQQEGQTNKLEDIDRKFKTINDRTSKLQSRMEEHMLAS